MKIRINNVEGTTPRKGIKQNKEYTIVKERDAKNFYDAVDEKGKEFSIWNVKGDWSELGIWRVGVLRVSYTKAFELIKEESPATGTPCMVNYKGQMVESLNFGRLM